MPASLFEKSRALGEGTEINNEKSPWGMKLSNLPILEFRNHVTQRGGFHKLQPLSFCALARANVSLRFYGCSQISSLIMKAIHFRTSEGSASSWAIPKYISSVSWHLIFIPLPSAHSPWIHSFSITENLSVEFYGKSWNILWSLNEILSKAIVVGYEWNLENEKFIREFRWFLELPKSFKWILIARNFWNKNI